MQFFPSVLDSSMLSAYKSCGTLFKYQYLDCWASPDPSPHLHAGGAFAHALEVTRRCFYENQTSAEFAIYQGLKALEEFWGDYVPPPYIAKTLDRMKGAFEFYYANYPLLRDGNFEPILLPSGRRAIEFGFAHPLPIAHPVSGDPLIYAGRADAIVNFAGAQYLCDEKTTSSLGPTWSRQWDLRAQFTGYAWGAKLSGIDVAGTIVRGVSILKTKFETQQVPVYTAPWMIERWYEELLETIELMLFDYRRGYYRHALDHACTDFGGCQYRDACLSQDPVAHLQVKFTHRRWDPLTRTSVELPNVSGTGSTTSERSHESTTAA